MSFPVDSKYIQAAEQALGVIFPDVFKQKMMADNGGELTVEYEEDDEEIWQLYPFLDTSDKKRTSRTGNHIVEVTLKARKELKNFPAAAVIIASDSNGDYLVLMPDKKDKTKLQESIHLWMHETGELAVLIDEMEAMFFEEEDDENQAPLSFSQFADNDNVDSKKPK